MISKMKSSVRRMALMMVVLFVATAAFAQEKDKAGEGAKTVTTEMKTQLGLNDSQYSKVLDINKTFIAKAVEAETIANATDKAKKMKTLNEEKETKMKSVLTETQYKTYGAKRADFGKKLRQYYK